MKATVGAIFEIETVRSLVLLDLYAAPQMDMHSAQMLGSMADELATAGIQFQAVEARASVRERLRAEGLDAKLGAVNRLTSVADVLDDFQKQHTNPSQP